MYSFDDYLAQSDLTPYPGEIFHQNMEAWQAIFNQDNFVLMIIRKLEETILENNCNRFCFIVLLLLAYDKGNRNYQPVFLCMMDFVIRNFSINSDIDNENVIEAVLDLIWHQDTELKNLNRDGQLKLFSFLKITTGFKYEVSDYGEATFFAVKKSIDLIKYQNDYGDTRVLQDMFLNHFDILIRNEAAEWIKD